MQLIRQFESMAEEKYKMEGKIRGFFHAYVGQEAIAAGCMTATKPEDSFITGYRDHGLAIAKGVSVNSCMAELYGKATGNAKGKGGSMHFFGKDVNFFGGHGIVGAQIGAGAGLAFAETTGAAASKLKPNKATILIMVFVKTKAGNKSGSFYPE